MKKVLITLAILSMVPALAFAKPNPANYTLTAHVQSSHFVLECDSILVGGGSTAGHTICSKNLHLNVVIDGKKYELDGGGYDYLLRLGDYKAKMLPDDSSASSNPPADYEYHRKFEFLFPDGKTRKYSVVGESE